MLPRCAPLRSALPNPPSPPAHACQCADLTNGDFWAGDNIRCHVCGNEYLLECDMDTDLLSDNSVK